MSSLKTRVLASIAGLLTLFGIALLSAPSASASVPTGSTSTVTCYNGAASCTQVHYSFIPPGTSGGAFHIYYVIQWSTSKASYKVIQVRWVNNSNATVYWGDEGLYDPSSGYTTINQGGSSTTYAIGAGGGTYTFNEASFNGSAKGIYHSKGTGVLATSDANTPSWEYHVSGHTSFDGAFYLP